MIGEPFTLQLPRARTSSVVFASPHSGRSYSAEFLTRTMLDETSIRSSEDAFVDRLFAAAPRFGAPLLTASAPRAYVDLNRSPDELDPALIHEVPASVSNPRVASGLGVIPRVVSNGRTIYRGKLPLSEAMDRLQTVWHPYHAQLQSLLKQSCARFGEAILIDCHSMPHEAIESISHGRRPAPQIVLGDRFGAAAGAEIVERVEALFATAGFSVARNTPFAGAYTAQHYGRPSRGQHVIQIEIDRSLYMDERTVTANSDYPHVRALITEVIAGITAMGRANEQPLAAE